MRRTTVTIHASWGGGETKRIRGWAADLYGIPVVLCRLGAQQDWHCVEPRVGRPLTGRSWPTREAALDSARRQLDAHAADKGLPPGEALEALVRHWLDRRPPRRFLATTQFDVPTDWSKRWPCSTLAGCHVSMGEGANGDLVELTVTCDGEPVDTTDLEAAELEAAREQFADADEASAKLAELTEGSAEA